MSDIENSNAQLAARKVAEAGGFLTFEQYDSAMRPERYFTPINWTAGFGLSRADRKANSDKLCAFAAVKADLLVQTETGYRSKTA